MKKSFREILADQMGADAIDKQTPPAPSMKSFNWSETTLNFANFPREKRANSSFSVESYKTQTQSKVHPRGINQQPSKGGDMDAHPKSAGTAAPSGSSAGRAPKAEPRVPLAQLKPAHRVHAQILIDCGARELEQGLSRSLLKRAHRSLAKRLHPDMAAHQQASASAGASAKVGAREASLSPKAKAASYETFLKMQKAYRALDSALPEYLKDSADDNGSSSAPGFPHPNAA